MIYFLFLLTNFIHGNHLPDEILIKWKKPPATEQWEVPSTGIILTKVKRLGSLPWELWKLPHGKHVDEIFDFVKSAPEVEACEKNQYRYPLGKVPNDPLVTTQWHLDRVQAFAGWEFEVGSSTPTTIAIMDTGINISHIDLSSATEKVWTNPVDLPGGGDQDANGKIDDIWGWNFGNLPQDNDVTDCLGHGTFVASIAGALTNNSIGIAGINWGAKILPIKVFGGSDCSSPLSAVAEGLDYAVDIASRHAAYTGRMVINMSIGCPGSNSCGVICDESQLEKDAIKLALSAGILVIAAKGNCGTSQPITPVDYPGVIGVGATDQDDKLASFSNYGSGTDMVAPGKDIVGANKNGGFGNNPDDGTSFSTPLVSGAAALIMNMLPTATTTQVVDSLFNGADDLGTNGRDDFYGYGRLNLFRSLRLVRYGTLSDLDNLNSAIGFPNPFISGTHQVVTLSVPKEIVGQNTQVEIYDISGLLIREMNGSSWDAKNSNGAQVASGIYIFQIKTDRGRASGRVIVINNL